MVRWGIFTKLVDPIFTKLIEMTLLLTLILTVLLQRNTLLFCSVTTLFTSLALNTAKSSIPFGQVKRQSQAWWSAEVEEAISERRKAFSAAHRCDEDC